MGLSSILKAAVAICLTVFLTACATNQGSGNSGYGNDTNVEAEEANNEVTVTIKNFVFEPALIKVSAGDTLVFVNEDTAPHTATDVGGVFDTGNIASGESGRITIADAGTYEYFCEIHPNMKGRIVVVE